jgi:hypothetical protein
VGYLDELSARVLLDRLPIPAIAVGDDGIIAVRQSRMPNACWATSRSPSSGDR